ncbi:MAG: hypothetical protein KBS68_04440 [Clostridiales bacterium]|nr:hypothetical protein [Candidatus Crickella merdequi]
MFKGITVTLYEREEVGTDAFNKKVYREVPVQVENVLVESLTADDLVSVTSLYGKQATYRLCIPKGDTHKWEDCRVDFFGEKWRVFGFAQEWIEENVPGSWNKKVMVERYG